ncbi:MAG: hypothetical protein R2845_10450 [Thermomicrobiales bacterium]
MVAQVHELIGFGSSRAIGFAQGEQRLLFVAVDEPSAGRPRMIHAQIVDRTGSDDRFSGLAGGSIVSLASTSGAMLVGVLGEHDLNGSVVFPDGQAQTFAIDLALI